MLASGPGASLSHPDKRVYGIDDAYRVGDRQSHLTPWTGQPQNHCRKRPGTLVPVKRAVSIIGGIQPELLFVPSGQGENQQDGFIPRYLSPVMPDARPGDGTITSSEKDPSDAMTVFRRLRN